MASGGGGHKAEEVKDKILPAPMKPWAAPEGHGSSHINVEWSMPPAVAAPVEYELQSGYRLSGKWSTVPTGLEEDPVSDKRRISGLKPNQKHIVRVRARFAGGFETWGPWSAKSETMATLAEEESSPRAGTMDALPEYMKEFESVPHSELKQSYTCTWKHTVLGHRGDPDAKSTIIKMPVVLSVSEQGVRIALRQTASISASFTFENIKRYRTKGSNAFVLTTGMLNSKDASVMMWAHGMEAHRGDAPYQFEFELETKDGRLLGGAIMKASRQHEDAEEMKMRAMMNAPPGAPPAGNPFVIS